jgi:hypothetical protein
MTLEPWEAEDDLVYGCTNYEEGFLDVSINQSINQSNVFIKPLNNLMSQSAVQKPSLNPQTASNADIEALPLSGR